MPLDNIRTLVKEDLQALDQAITTHLDSEVDLTREISQHILAAGGKRLRPLLIILVAHFFTYPGEQHIQLAAIIELIHTATLLHDDVVDNAHTRRSHKTANAVWGNQASVLVGDFIYSRTFQMMIKLENQTIMDILANASNTIASGEIMQLLNCGKSDVSEATYMDTIGRKTATLFAAATQLGALISNQDEATIAALKTYGFQLGMAFQLIDDALDYGSSERDIGKALGQDLAEGKPTLPLIYLLTHSKPEHQAFLREALQKRKQEYAQEVLQMIQQSKALTYTYEKARQAMQKALQALNSVNVPHNSYKQALVDLAQYTIERSY
jgi:octaprenyl-diphosphate synthase